MRLVFQDGRSGVAIDSRILGDDFDRAGVKRVDSGISLGLVPQDVMPEGLALPHHDGDVAVAEVAGQIVGVGGRR